MKKCYIWQQQRQERRRRFSESTPTLTSAATFDWKRRPCRQKKTTSRRTGIFLTNRYFSTQISKFQFLSGVWFLSLDVRLTRPCFATCAKKPLFFSYFVHFFTSNLRTKLVWGLTLKRSTANHLLRKFCLETLLNELVSADLGIGEKRTRERAREYLRTKTRRNWSWERVKRKREREKETKNSFSWPSAVSIRFRIFVAIDFLPKKQNCKWKQKMKKERQNNFLLV